MAKIPITPENIKALELAYDHFYPEGIIFSSTDRIPFSYGGREWLDKKAFAIDLSDTSNLKVDPDKHDSVKRALGVIEQMPAEETTG